MRDEAKRGAPNPWLFEEPEETRGLGFEEIRQQQQKIIQGIELPSLTLSSNRKNIDLEENLPDFCCGLECSLTPTIRVKAVGLLKHLVLLCLETPEEETPADTHPGGPGK